MMKLTSDILFTFLFLSIASQGVAETPLEKANQIVSEAKQSCVSDGGQFRTNEYTVQIFEFKTADSIEELVIVDGHGFECSVAKS